MDLSLPFCTITPIGHVEMTDHVFVPLYLYTIYEDSLDLSLLAITHNLIYLCQ